MYISGMFSGVSKFFFIGGVGVHNPFWKNFNPIPPKKFLTPPPTKISQPLPKISQPPENFSTPPECFSTQLKKIPTPKIC